MANVTITQLPAAGPITGTESVPIVQNGVTVQTTTAAIAASPSQTQTFLTVNTEATLPNSRYLSTGLGLGLSDGGALSYYRITLNGASGSLESASTGIIAKDGASSVVSRTLQTSGSGLSVTDGNGVSGNPTFSLTGQVLSLANASGAGLVALPNNGSVVPRVLTGTVSQIDVANGSGAAGNPTLSISSDVILPGTGAMTVPQGTDVQKPGGSIGMFRYNTTTNAFEGYTTAGWGTFSLAGGVTTFSAGSTGLTPSTPTAGNVVLAGTLNVASGGTGAADTAGARANLDVPTRTGGDASGTWSISISGNAATATTSTNVAGGAANRIIYNTGAGTTSFITAPAIANTFLEWSGSAFQWSSNPLGTVTSVGLALPSEFTISNSPVTTSGTLTGAWASQTQNYFLAAPAGSSGTPSFRAIVPGDVPTLNQNTTGNAATATLAAASTNIAGGAAGSIPYQTAGSTTTFLAAGSGVLVGGTTPSYSTAPALTGTNFSSIPNGALQNSSITLGTTSISLGGTALTLGGLTSVAVTQNPTTALQVATKQYVDGLVSSGITYHTPVKYEVPSTTGNLNAIYNQPGGPGVGVGATLTNNGTLAAFAPDGPTAAPGDRILIYNQTNQFENGVYTVTTVGNGSTPWVLTRATDADTYALKSTTGLGEGDAFFIQAGNTGAGETYVCNTSGPITFGTTAITFVQVSASQIYSAGTGLTLSGTQFSLTTPVVLANGGTGLTSYTAGDLVYFSTGTSFTKLAIGASSTILTSTGSAPQWTTPSSITVGTATNAVNIGITNDTTTNATMYPVWVTANTGNLPAKVTSTKLSFNPSTGVLTATGGISGGTF